MVGDEDDIILDAYRLAKYYGQNPQVFLDMPLSEVRTHMENTAKLARIMQSASEHDRENE